MMNVLPHYFLAPAFNCFENVFIASLNSRQKKVAAIALLLLSVAICTFKLYQHFYFKKKLCIENTSPKIIFSNFLNKKEVRQQSPAPFSVPLPERVEPSLIRAPQADKTADVLYPKDLSISEDENRQSNKQEEIRKQTKEEEEQILQQKLQVASSTQSEVLKASTRALYLQGKFKEVVQQFQHALNTQPPDPAISQDYANFLTLHEQFLRLQIRIEERLAIDYPNLTMSLLFYGHLKFLQGECIKTLERLNATLILHPHDKHILRDQTIVLTTCAQLRIIETDFGKELTLNFHVTPQQWLDIQIKLQEALQILPQHLVAIASLKEFYTLEKIKGIKGAPQNAISPLTLKAEELAAYDLPIKLEEAMLIIRKALEEEPTHPIALIVYQRILYRQGTIDREIMRWKM